MWKSVRWDRRVNLDAFDSLLGEPECYAAREWTLERNDVRHRIVVVQSTTAPLIHPRRTSHMFDVGAQRVPAFKAVLLRNRALSVTQPRGRVGIRRGLPRQEQFFRLALELVEI